MFDAMISQTRGAVTVGRSRGELEGLLAGSAGVVALARFPVANESWLEGLVAGAGRVVAALNALQARCATEIIDTSVPLLTVSCSVTPCW
ncbi:MAG: hypothetical protein KTU85_07830 [Acidimicrobiia bacterium]|nr:hypothetical protein [Acidimicrobiia bacterium]